MPKYNINTSFNGELILDTIIEGEPLIKPRPRVRRFGKAYYPNNYKEKQDALSYMLLSKIGKTVAETKDRYLVVCSFYQCSKRGDIDNRIKALLDAGNTIVWIDDKSVIMLLGSSVYVKNNPRTELLVYKLSDIPVIKV